MRLLPTHDAFAQPFRDASGTCKTRCLGICGHAREPRFGGGLTVARTLSEWVASSSTYVMCKRRFICALRMKFNNDKGGCRVDGDLWRLDVRAHYKGRCRCFDLILVG